MEISVAVHWYLSVCRLKHSSEVKIQFNFVYKYVYILKEYVVVEKGKVLIPFG